MQSTSIHNAMRFGVDQPKATDDIDGQPWTDDAADVSAHQTRTGREPLLTRQVVLNRSRVLVESSHNARKNRQARDEPKSRTTRRAATTTMSRLGSSNSADPALLRRLNASGLIAPTAFHSPLTIRVQFLEEALKLFCGERYGNHGVCKSGHFGRDLMQAATMNSSMQAAVDTLCLAHLGNVYRDKRLLREAQHRQIATITNLRLDLEHYHHDNEAVLGTIYFLALQAFYKDLSGDGAQVHFMALRQLLLARGPDRPLSDFGKLLLFNLVWLINKLALRTRKDLGALHGPAWQKYLPAFSAFDTEQNDIRFALPPLLERVDALVYDDSADASQGCEEALRQLTTFSGLGHRLQTWLMQWLTASVTSPYTMTNMSSFPHFQRHLDGLVHANSPFERVLLFPTLQHAVVHTRTWLDMLQIRTAQLELSSRCPREMSSMLLHIWKSEADECADRLCQSVMYLSLPQFGIGAIMMVVDTLYFAAVWYAKSHNLPKVEWCKHVWSTFEDDGYHDLYLHTSLDVALAPYLSQSVIPR